MSKTGAAQVPTTALGHAAVPGITCMVASGLLLTLNDAAVKWLSGSLALGQIVASRGLVALVVILAVLWFSGGLRRLRTRQARAQLARALMMVLSTLLFVSGLRWLPLADAIALAFIGPVLVTAMAPSLLGERVGWRRWLAVLVGFAGMLVMLRPGSSSFVWAALLPVGAALAGAFRDVLTRRMAAVDSSLVTLFYSTLAVTVFGACLAPFGWSDPTLADALLLILAGLLLCGAHFLQIESFRFAQAATVVPYKYASLIWAAIAGYVLWGDIPDRPTAAGAVLVIGSGLYILHRERRHQPRPAASRDGGPI